MTSRIAAKNIVLVSVAMLMAALFGAWLYLKLQDNDAFLAVFRYKDLGRWQSTGIHYSAELFQRSDSLFAYGVRYSEAFERRAITWNGDTLFQQKLACGYLSPEHAEIRLWGYDSTILAVEEEFISPIRQGTTRAYIRYPDGTDTLEIAVVSRNGQLTINLVEREN